SLVPVTGGRMVERLVRSTGPIPGMRRILVGLGLSSLRPECFELEQMRRVADAIASRNLHVFNVMFHSSVALAGATPYVRTDADLDAFCRRLEGLIEYLLKTHDARPMPLRDVPDHLGNAVLNGQVV